MICYVKDLPPDLFASMPLIKPGRHKRSKLHYIFQPITFDIETTTIDEIQQAVMYIWQAQLTEDITCIGRTWDEFQALYNLVNSSLPDDAALVCYVHNLSFEFQFLKSVIPIEDPFAMDSRKVLKFSSGKWEFRCSYLHSNMSLAKYLQALGVPDQKLEMDYSVKRWPWTELSDEDLEYCVNDVKGLREALIREMEKDKDDLYTIPLTSTGYVRRPAKKALQKYSGYIRRMLPDREIFDMLRWAFRGGNTHANRYNSNRIIRARPGFPINSWDISSSYPSVLLTQKFPCKFVQGRPEYLRIYLEQNRACLIDISMFDLSLKDERWGCPYLSRDKCMQISGGVYDNGRILSCSECRMVITEIDLSIIEFEYQFDFQVNRLYTARKKMLPKPFRDLLMDMYRQKTALKGVDDYLYMKTKNKFNSFYGMTVQNPCKPEMIFQDGIFQMDLSKSEDDQIREYQQKGWLPYQWGVWVTAYARLKLEEGLQAIPPECFLYADTDSVKFIGDYTNNFEELNAQFIHDELSAEDPRGIRHYIGIYERDNDYPIYAFKTMGAKKYCYTDQRGLHLTVSGVSKRSGAAELGSIENFQEGFVFREAGGTESIYNDDPPMDHWMIDSHQIRITSNQVIQESTYTLSLTDEYRRLINYLSNADIKRDVYFDYD